MSESVIVVSRFRQEYGKDVNLYLKMNKRYSEIIS
jgi:hypothetical protein